MLVLRKVLGYCTLSFFLLACLFGCIAKFTVNLGDLFKSLTSPEAILRFGGDWLLELIFFIIIGIMCIVALAKFHTMDDVKQEGQLQKLTLLHGICELACAAFFMMFYIVTKNLGGMGMADWCRLIIPVVVIILTIVRKAAFVGKNQMAARIMGAINMLLMFVLCIMMMTSPGFGSLFAMVQVFVIITYVLGVGFNVVSIFKK